MTKKTKFQLVAEHAALPMHGSKAKAPSTASRGKRTGPASKPSRTALADSELRYRRLFEAARDGILILDARTGQITDANPYLEDLLGYPHAELLGRTLWEIGPFKDVAASRQSFCQLQNRHYVRYENLPLETKNHEIRNVEFVSNVYMVDDVEVIQCNIRDITARTSDEDRRRKVHQDLSSLVARLQARADTFRDQANHDPLTGLFNRRYLDDSLPRELSRAQRQGTSLCVAILDIDHFKRFNDMFGHDVGDLVLRECALVLTRNLRSSDIACRLGGEEFALVLPDSSLEDTRQRVEQICTLARQMTTWHNGQLLGTMTLSAGIAAAPEHASTAQELLRAADIALYAAKQAGREQVVLYTSGGTGCAALARDTPRNRPRD
jgi:diguanylate cyclase (GGDEF)-like protein/PAS domain S-box-containing protein